MTIASIATRKQHHVRTIDITGAYLNADMSKQETYLELDPTMAPIDCQIDPSYDQLGLVIRPNESIIVILKKALYGCVESANPKLSKELDTMLILWFLVYLTRMLCFE
jgi:hypothetical protein